MNDEYSEAFKSIVPDAPSADRWADGARRKRRNRRRVMGGVAGVAILALAVPLTLSLQTPMDVIAAPEESMPPMPLGPGADACWEATEQPRTATEEGVTVGAVQAWLCGDAGVPEMFPGEVGPIEPLVDGIDDLVQFIRENEVLRDGAACTLEAGTDYRIVLDYEDGSRRVVSGGLYGCGVIDDGDRKLTGSRELYGRALDLWRRQRESSEPPADMVTWFGCRPESRSVVADLPPGLRPMIPLSPEDAVSGYACVEWPETEYSKGWMYELDADVVAIIAASVASESQEGIGKDHLPTWLTLTGPWGEALTLQRLPGDVFQWFDGGGVAMLWTPSATVLAELAPAFEDPEG